MIVVRINDDDYDESDDDADDNAWKDWTILDDQLGGWTLCAHKADDWVQFQGQTTTNYYLHFSWAWLSICRSLASK